MHDNYLAPGIPPSNPMWELTTSGGGRSLKVIRHDPGALGAEIEALKASRGRYGEVVSPPHPTKGSEERRKLPQRDPGRSPRRKRFLVHFEAKKAI